MNTNTTGFCLRVLCAKVVSAQKGLFGCKCCSLCRIPRHHWCSWNPYIPLGPNQHLAVFTYLTYSYAFLKYPGPWPFSPKLPRLIICVPLSWGRQKSRIIMIYLPRFPSLHTLSFFACRSGAIYQKRLLMTRALSRDRITIVANPLLEASHLIIMFFMFGWNLQRPISQRTGISSYEAQDSA